MATGDILFLLLFVVLPTAIIVSGIWVMLFVRTRASMPARAVERTHEDDADIVPVPALEEPAIDDTISIAAVSADTSAPIGPDLNEPAEPALSEREAIANVNLVTADLLFDQPQPPPEPWTPSADPAPTEEMPAIVPVSDALPGQSTTDDGEQATESNAAAEPDATEKANEAEPAEERPDAQVNDALIGATSELAELPDIGEEDAQPLKAPDHEPDPGRDEAAPGGADPGGSADDQAAKRAPLRLIPSEDADPRDRRRARGAGRQVPQLGRSVRRQERRVER